MLNPNLKRKMKKIIASAILLVMGGAAYSQNCTGTHSLYCNPYLGKDKTQRKTEEQANWQSTTQSKSGAFVQGDTVNISIVIQKDTKYRITVCSADESLDGKIQMMLLETKTEVDKQSKPKKVTRPKTDANGNIIYNKELGEEYFDENGNAVRDTIDGEPIMETVTINEVNRVYVKKEVELYDNADDNNAQSYIFTTDRTRKLTVRIITPVTGSGGKKTTKGLGTEAVSCVGVLIEHAKGPATGVNKAR